MKKKLVVIDLSNFIFRAFYAVRMLHSPDGVPVNAVYGVIQMLIKILTDYRPTHIIIAQDTKEGASVRKELYEEYKGHRPSPPEDLIPQFGIVDTVIRKLNIKVCSAPNYEADDVIGSVVTQWKNDFDDIYILSGDKDLMQFVDDKIKVIDTMKEKIYGPEEVLEKMGVTPAQIVDYLSLVGDSSDNIPGVKGIGDKGAIKLLTEFGTLENCLNNVGNITNKRASEALKNHIDDAILSKKLVTIFTDLKLNCNENETEYSYTFNDEAREYLKDLGFKSILTRLEQLQNKSKKLSEELFTPSFEPTTFNKIVLKNHDEIKEGFNLLLNKSYFSWSLVFDQTSSMDANLVGVAFCYSEKDVYYFKVDRETQILFFDFLNKLNENNIIICDDAKRDLLFFYHNNIKIRAGFFDVALAHFETNPDAYHDFGFIVKELFQKDIFSLDLKKRRLVEYDLDSIIHFVSERAYYLLQMKLILQTKIEVFDLYNKVFKEIDTPCLKVLARMEERGVAINDKYFKELSIKFQNELNLIEKEIEKVSGDKINLRSPKQVSTLLFEKLNLPVIKKTKTGNSTDSEVLEELASMNLSEIPNLILKFRELEKLLSTYVTILPTLVNTNTNRVHTHFNLIGAATGRLSSDNPNLQNIPIRSENGKLVRRGFVATPGFLLLSADYSQVELRILAHFSKDPTMVKAFNEDVDIHSQTAAEILDIPISEVTDEQRSQAKAVNFGLMYGQSSYGLSKSINISRNEAKEFITKYFEKFSHVKSYLDSLKETCESKIYSQTLLGRKRFLPDIKSQNRTIKSFAERMSINSPIQGTAADIIKIAMINIQNEIDSKGLNSKMILQVHDELIFEVTEEEVDLMKELVKRNMENAVILKTPLKVDISMGVNWLDLNF